MPHHEGHGQFEGFRVHPSDIGRGYEVFGSDSKKLGEVADVGPDYFHVKKGFFFTKDAYVPFDAVTGVERKAVHLNVPSDRVDRMGWDQPMAGRMEQPGMQRRGEEEIRVPIREEELTARKRLEQAGEIEISKHVTEEQRTIGVPRMHEEVTVERQRVDRPSEEPIGADETFSVPITEERIEIEKRPVVREELVIKKHPEITEERFTETIRKEEVDVERHAETGRAEAGRAERGLAEGGYPETGYGREPQKAGFAYGDIQRGWEVDCADRKKLGNIVEVADNFLHVEKGFLFTKDLYIPQSAIDSVDRGHVYLNVGCDRIQSMSWDRPPTGGTRY